MSHRFSQREIDDEHPKPGPLDRVFERVYPELRALAASYLRHERDGHTLQPTALVNEVFYKFANSDRTIVEEKSLFMRAAASAMRQILIDHARAAKRDKRGGGAARVEIDEVRLGKDGAVVGVIDFDDALSKFAKLDARGAEVVHLRVFAGLTMEETAATLGIATSTASEDWKVARAWFRTQFE